MRNREMLLKRPKAELIKRLNELLDEIINHFEDVFIIQTHLMMGECSETNCYKIDQVSDPDEFANCVSTKALASLLAVIIEGIRDLFHTSTTPVIYPDLLETIHQITIELKNYSNKNQKKTIE